MSDRATRPVGDVDRVLVVGDTDRLEDVAVSLTREFEAATLIRERSADRALTRLETVESAVDCLVCDVGTETGLERLSRLVDALPETPILAVIEHADDDGRARSRSDRSDRRDEAARALEVGATDVLSGDESSAVVAARVRNAAGAGSTDRENGAQATDEPRADAILAHTAAVVCVLEPDGTIVELSPAIEDRFGHTPNELEGRPLSRLVRPEDRSRLTATIADVSSGPVGTTTEIAVRLRRADGAWVRCDLTVANRLGDPAVDALVVTITGGEPTAAEGAAASAVGAALDRLERAVFAVGPDDELQYWNDVAASLFESPPERDVLGWSVLPEAIRHEFAERIGQVRATDEPVSFRTTDPASDGELDVTVTPGRGDGTVTVFTAPARRPAEDGESRDDASPVAIESDARERDRDDRALLESVIDALEDGVLVLEDERVRFANATVSRLAGAERIVGRSVEDLFDPDLAAAVAERAGSTVVRWMDPLSGTLAVGDRRPAVAVFVAPLSGPERTLCLVRDRRRSPESALTMLENALVDVQASPSHPALRETVLRAALDWTGADAAGWYALEGDRLEPLALETAGDHDGADRRAIEPDDRFRSALADRDPGDVVEEPSLVAALTRTGIRAERVLSVPLDSGDALLLAGPDPVGGERIERTALSALASAATLAGDRLESSRDLQTCRRARSRAETAIDREIRTRAVERALLASDSLETLERRLCEGLVAVERSRRGGDGTGATDGGLAVAWVGRVDERTGTIDPVAWAGTDGEGSAVASVPIDADAPDPASRVAALGGGPIVVDLERAGADAATGSDIDSHPDEVARWHQSLHERGLRWAVSVPVDHDGVRYGTLTAYAADRAAVDEGAQRRLRHLATVAGVAIGPLRRTTPAGGVTELEVAIRDGDPLAAVAAELDRRLDLRAIVPRASGGATAYCVLADVEPEALERVVDNVDAVTAARALGRSDEGGGAAEGAADHAGEASESESAESNDRTDANRRVGVELRLASQPITDAVAAHGGTVRAVVPDGPRTRVVLEVPTDVTVRSVVSHLEREYPGVELLARRERDRSPRVWQPFETRLQDELSDRQRRTLEAAYHSGFFEWPRERTGEDVAAILGVSQPTFSRHLRSAQRNLLSLLFEDEFDDERA